MPVFSKNGIAQHGHDGIQMTPVEQPDQPEFKRVESLPNRADFAPDVVYGVKLTKRNIAFRHG